MVRLSERLDEQASELSAQHKSAETHMLALSSSVSEHHASLRWLTLTLALPSHPYPSVSSTHRSGESSCVVLWG